ncbi:MAG: hypothetical protein VX496_02020 [Planctomycetota bacterium]|nr:hypothetical protein [Planctomycetota bacterium]
MNARNHLSLLTLLVALLAAASSSSAAEKPGLLELSLRNQNERNGDFDKFALELIDAIGRFKEDPRVELLTQRLADSVSSMRNSLALTEGLEKLLTAGLPGTAHWKLSNLLADLYKRAGRHEEALKLSSQNGILTRFLIIGPFGKALNAPLEHPFAPEKNIDLTRQYKDGWQKLSWRPVQRKEVYTSIDPFSHIYPNRGVSYLLCQVRSAAPRNAVLHLMAGNEIKAWCNGVPVLDDTRRNEYLSIHHRAGIRLEKGWNHILIKCATRILLRVTDPQGHPLRKGSLEEEGELTLHKLAANPAGSWQGPYATGAGSQWIEKLATAGRDNLELALEHIGISTLQRDEHNTRSDLAVDQAANALALAPGDPWVRYHAAGIFQGATYLPAAQAKSRARNALEKAIELDSEFLPAQLQLAGILQRDQKADEAATALRKTVEKHPEFLAGFRSLQSCYSELGWETEEKQVLKRIGELSPGSSTPWVTEASLYRKRHNLARALEYYAEGYSRNQSRTSLLSTMAELNKSLGNSEKALELLRLRLKISGDNRSVAEMIARQLIEEKRSSTKEAISWYSRAVGNRDWNPSHKKALARLYSAGGDEKNELAMYRESLELAPGDLQLRKFIESRDPKQVRFWEPYDELIEDWLPRVPLEGPMVEKAQALSILDIGVVKVYRDGSSKEYIHQAFKLLSEEAKDQIAKVRTAGEILKLRTITAEGESLEPVAALSGGNYIMPGMLPGAQTEFAYLVENSNARGKGYRHGPFFFQDFNYRQSFLLSRLVYILPPGLDSDIVSMALDQGNDTNGIARVKQSDKTLEDGTRVVTFESRNAGRIQSERAMPHYTGYVPSTQIMPKTSWKDIERNLTAYTRQTTLLTPELRATANEVTAGLKDPLEKARALYDHINKIITKDDGSSTAIRVLLEKSGNRTFLFKALIDAAGVPSRWAFLRMDEDLERKANWDYPSSSFFRAPHLLLQPAGKDPLYVSLQYRDLPFGFLPEFYGTGKAFILSPDGFKIEDIAGLPEEIYESASSTTWTLGDDVAVNVEFLMETKAAQGWMQKDRFSTLNAFQINLMTRGLATQLFPGAKVEKGGFVGINDKSQPFALEFKLVAPKLLVRSGADFLLPPVLQPSQLVRSLGAPPARKHPYNVRQRRVKNDRIEARLGENFLVAKLPTNVKLDHPLADYSLTYLHKDGKLVIERRLRIEPGTIAPAEFTAFLNLLQKADAAEKERVVLQLKK